MWNLFPGSRLGVDRSDAHSGRFSAPLLETSGADPANDDAGGDSPSPEGQEAVDGDPDPSASVGHADDDESLEDLIADAKDDDADNRTPEERIKALAKKNRQMRRRFAKHLPTLSRLKDLDLDDLIARAQRGDTFATMIANNPRLKALLHGEDAPAPAADKPPKGKTPAAAAGDDDEEFDESALPFDPDETDTNRYFAKMARDNHELKKQLKQLMGKETQREEMTAQQAAAAERNSWKTAIEAAAEQLPEGGVRIMFKDAMAGAYVNRKGHGKSVTDIIAHYLKVNGVSSSAAKKANTAAAAAAPAPGNPRIAAAAQRERIATTNTNLPRTQAPPAGAPTTARKSGETLKDVHRRIRNLGA